MPAFVIMGALASLSPLRGHLPDTLKLQWHEAEHKCRDVLVTAQREWNFNIIKELLEEVKSTRCIQV